MKHNLPSGATFEVSLLPYEKAWEVSQHVAAVFEKIDLDLTDLNASVDVLKLKGPLLKVVASSEIIAEAKVCWSRCLYNGLKIDQMTFDKSESRADFIPCVFYSLRENISPFFSGLLSFLKTS
jgi:hypothetical protein